MRSFSAKEPNTAFGSTPIVALELSEPFFPFLAESGLIIFTRIFFAATTSFSTTFFSFSTTSCSLADPRPFRNTKGRFSDIRSMEIMARSPP